MAQISLISSPGRTADSVWPSVHSWYGGLPRLSEEISWPTGQNKQPLHFLAQLDLSEISSIASSLGCPAEGHLAFFANTEFDQSQNAARHEVYDEFHWPCAVIYIKKASENHTALLPEASPVYGESWQYYFPGEDPEHPPRTFGRLAVEFTGFNATSQSLTERLKLHWKENPSYSPYPAEFEVSSNPSDVLWRTVKIVCQECLMALDSRETAFSTYLADREDTPRKKEKFLNDAPAVEKILAVWLDQAKRNNLNQPIGIQSGVDWMNDLDGVRATFEEIEVESSFVGKHNRRPGSGGHMDLPNYWYYGRATKQAYKQMITGFDPDFSALPDEIRKTLRRDLSSVRFPPKSQDMFCGVDADSNMNPISDDLRQDATLLLELNSSFLWTWGDEGKLQFWIRNSDLLNRNWHKVFLLLRSS